MNQSALCLADFKPKNSAKHQLVENEEVDIFKLFQHCQNVENKSSFWIVSKDKKAVFKKLIRPLRKITAAGGIVKNGKGEYLFIFRLGKWDLPKGKVDKGEKIKKAAVREVEEECGIHVDYRGKKLTTTYHLYTIKNELVVKKTVWYEMGVNGKPKLIPQQEEDITKAIWLKRQDLDQVRENTYPLIHDLLTLL